MSGNERLTTTFLCSFLGFIAQNFVCKYDSGELVRNINLSGSVGNFLGLARGVARTNSLTPRFYVYPKVIMSTLKASALLPVSLTRWVSKEGVDHDIDLLVASYDYEPPVWMLINYTLSTFKGMEATSSEIQVRMRELFGSRSICQLPSDLAIAKELLLSSGEARGISISLPEYCSSSKEKIYKFRLDHLPPVLLPGFACFSQWADIVVAERDVGRKDCTSMVLPPWTQHHAPRPCHSYRQRTFSV